MKNILYHCSLLVSHVYDLIPIVTNRCSLLHNRDCGVEGKRLYCSKYPDQDGMPDVLVGEDCNRSSSAPTWVTTLDRVQPSPILWLPNHHSLRPMIRGIMAMKKDEVYKYNRQQVKGRHGGAPIN